MITDWHSHYPMHLMTKSTDEVVDRITRVRGRRPHRDKFQAAVLWLLSRLISYRSFFDEERVNLELLDSGGVKVALSVLYAPFDEMDLSKRYGAPPDNSYLSHLEDQMTIVEAHVEADGRAVVVRNGADLEAALDNHVTALVHCVEGGFHLGDSDEDVTRAVHLLAQRGVAYITLAHLFWREVAANAPAIPFLPDWLYNLLFPQPREEVLAPRGRAAVAAMVEARVLVDLAHMREDAIHVTLDLLDDLDPQRVLPVVSTHAGYRFGKQVYMHSAAVIERIAARGGLVGLILAQHQLNDGIRRRRTKTIEQSFKVICRHIDRIHEITGSHEHVAFGTDLDGFIKPTMGGLETAQDLGKLPDLLAAEYGQVATDLITHGNTLRVLRRLWRPPHPTPAHTPGASPTGP